MKTKKQNKLLPILLTVVLIFTLIPAQSSYAATVTTPLNFDTDPATRSGDGWAWDNSAKTLTLNNFIFSANENKPAIYLPGDPCVIIVNGDNSITNTLWLGIQSKGSLTIKGSGSLKINTGDNAIDAIDDVTIGEDRYDGNPVVINIKSGWAGIYSDNNVTIKNGNINIEATADGIYACKDIKILGGYGTIRTSDPNDDFWSVTVDDVNNIILGSGIVVKGKVGNAYTKTSTIDLHESYGDYFKTFKDADDPTKTLTDIAFMTPIKNLTGVKTTTKPGKPEVLSATVNPANAAFNAYVWSIVNAGTTGAKLTNGNTITANSAGTVTVRATIKDGLWFGSPYTQDFRIEVKADKQTKPAISKVTVGKKKMTVKWKKVSVAQGIKNYQVQYREKGTKKWKTKNVDASKGSVVIKSLKKGKKYEVKLRTYRTAPKKTYSPFSKTVTSKKIK